MKKDYDNPSLFDTFVGLILLFTIILGPIIFFRCVVGLPV